MPGSLSSLCRCTTRVADRLANVAERLTNIVAGNGRVAAVAAQLKAQPRFCAAIAAIGYMVGGLPLVVAFVVIGSGVAYLGKRAKAKECNRNGDISIRIRPNISDALNKLIKAPPQAARADDRSGHSFGPTQRIWTILLVSAYDAISHAKQAQLTGKSDSEIQTVIQQISEHAVPRLYTAYTTLQKYGYDLPYKKAVGEACIFSDTALFENRVWLTLDELARIFGSDYRDSQKGNEESGLLYTMVQAAAKANQGSYPEERLAKAAEAAMKAGLQYYDDFLQGRANAIHAILDADSPLPAVLRHIIAEYNVPLIDQEITRYYDDIRSELITAAALPIASFVNQTN